ncbi:hypothetical protein GC207_08110 [bacterium]|nr:hypothetical protein [bacterium]
MSTSTFIQWWKEFRAVLPIWVGAMVTLWLYSLSNLFGGDHEFWQNVILMVGSVIMCSFVFTREFQERTLVWQLLQPVNRLAVLGRKFVVVLVLQLLFYRWYALLSRIDWLGKTDALVFGSLICFVAVTSCCLWAILIRNPINTMVVAFLVPVVILVILVPQLQSLAERIVASPDSVRTNFIFMQLWLSAMAVYGIVCAGLSVFLWRRMQLAGEASSVSRLDVGVTTRLMGDTKFRVRPIWFTLIRKELGLIRFIFWIFAAFIVAAIAFAVVDLTMTHMVAVAQSRLSEGEFLPKYTGIVSWQSNIRAAAAALFVLLMSLVPLLCGALAFAEETYLGTRAWELCQPIRSRAQWLMKLATSLTVSIAAGLVVPGVMVFLFQRLHIAGIDEQPFETGNLLQAVTLHLMLFSLAAWCATWSRTTVIAIMKAFLVVALFVFLFGEYASIALVHNVQYQSGLEPPDWRQVASMVSLIAIVAAVMNFRFVVVPTHRWVWQGTGILLISLLTSIPYLVEVLAERYAF